MTKIQILMNKNFPFCCNFNPQKRFALFGPLKHVINSLKQRLHAREKMFFLLVSSVSQLRTSLNYIFSSCTTTKKLRSFPSIMLGSEWVCGKQFFFYVVPSKNERENRNFCTAFCWKQRWNTEIMINSKNKISDSVFKFFFLRTFSIQ